jgi:hypothetical protein
VDLGYGDRAVECHDGGGDVPQQLVVESTCVQSVAGPSVCTALIAACNW